MSRNLKALGLALVAVFALSAIASSAASATEATFTSGSNWTTLSATSVSAQQVFEANENKEKVECSSISIDNATMGTDQKEITVTPTYGTTLAEVVTEAEATTTGCKIVTPANTFPATIHTENCHYTFTAEGTDGTVHITPTPTGGECEIKITAYFLGKFRPCFDVPQQTPTKATVTFTNETYVAGGKNVWDVKLTSDVEGITYTKTSICGEGHFNDAKYTGEATIKGTDTEGKATDVTFDPDKTV